MKWVFGTAIVTKEIIKNSDDYHKGDATVLPLSRVTKEYLQEKCH